MQGYSYVSVQNVFMDSIKSRTKFGAQTALAIHPIQEEDEEKNPLKSIHNIKGGEFPKEPRYNKVL